MKKEKSKKKKLNKTSKMSIFLYLTAILFFGYSIYSIYDTYNYVNQLISYGSIDMTTQLGDVVSYYIGTSAPFLFYAIVTWSVGYIVNKVNCISSYLMPVNTKENVVEEIKESPVVEDKEK